MVVVVVVVLNYVVLNSSEDFSPSGASPVESAPLHRGRSTFGIAAAE